MDLKDNLIYIWSEFCPCTRKLKWILFHLINWHVHIVKSSGYNYVEKTADPHGDQDGAQGPLRPTHVSGISFSPQSSRQNDKTIPQQHTLHPLAFSPFIPDTPRFYSRGQLFSVFRCPLRRLWRRRPSTVPNFISRVTRVWTGGRPLLHRQGGNWPLVIQKRG